jgi:hypothetical protein
LKEGMRDAMASEWKQAILKVLKKHYADKVHLQDIYREIPYYKPLTDYDKEPWKKGEQPRYQCWIREYLNILEKEGLVENVERGYWRYRPKMDKPI